MANRAWAPDDAPNPPVTRQANVDAQVVIDAAAGGTAVTPPPLSPSTKDLGYLSCQGHAIPSAAYHHPPPPRNQAVPLEEPYTGFLLNITKGTPTAAYQSEASQWLYGNKITKNYYLSVWDNNWVVALVF
jgi:hypothetical protein